MLLLQTPRRLIGAAARPALAALAILSSTGANAHPGDHGDAAALWHMLTEPDHLAMLALAVAVGWFGVRAWRARKLQRARQSQQVQRSTR